MSRDVQQCREHPNRHQRSVDDQRSAEAEEFSRDEFPAPDWPRQYGVERALVDLLGDKPDADEDRDYDAKEGNSRQPQVDDHQALNLYRDLTNQDRRTAEQERKCDQVVEHPVAHGLAESVGCDVQDSGIHDVAAPALEDASAATGASCPPNWVMK